MGMMKLSTVQINNGDVGPATAATQVTRAGRVDRYHHCALAPARRFHGPDELGCDPSALACLQGLKERPKTLLRWSRLFQLAIKALRG
jgi:hypothetical protein